MNMHYKKIRRVIVTGKMGERSNAFGWARDNKYNIITCSPAFNYTDCLIDDTRFRMILEKAI